ncbi:MAG: hypothetical protein ACYC6N_00865 [Pirellulaceae bacterium]
MKLIAWMILFTLMALMIGGCETSDERLAGFAERSTAEQAQQNRAAAEMTRETAENQRRTLETVERSRPDLIGLQKDLDHQRTTVEQERRELADERHRESLLAPVLTSIGMLLVTALPLVLCWYLLHTLKNAPTDEAAVTQLLVQDLVADRPVLLPAPREPTRRITHAIPDPNVIEEEPPF